MTESNLKRFAIPTALVIGGVTAGSFLAPLGLASAQDADADESTDPDSSDTDDSDGTDGTAVTDEDGVDETRPGRFGRRGLRRGPSAEVLTETLGLTAEEIRDGLADGKSLADLAAEQGVDTDDLVAALVAAATERIDQAVADGDIDAEAAEDKLAELEERITEMVDTVRPERSGRGGIGGRFGHGAEVLSETLGLTAEEIRDGLADGKSLADLAAEQGVSTEAVADALVAQATERIDEALADGRIDADRAAEAKADLEEMVAQAIEAEPFDLGRGIGRAEGRRMGRHHRGFGGPGHGTGTDDGAVTESSVELTTA